jgi:hypothetical protein
MQRKGVSKVVGRAATGALNISVLGGAVLGGIALMSWPIAAIGGVAYAALVASDVSNPDFRKRVLFGRETPERLPKSDAVVDPVVRDAVSAIASARVEIDAVVKATPERVQRNVRASLASLDELELHASTLVKRAESLSKYLATADRDAITTEIASHRKRAAQTRDDSARSDYELAATAAEERKQAVTDIATAYERTIANLSKIASTFKGIPSKLVRLRALDDQASDTLTDNVGSELERMNIDLRTFEQTLESIVA